MLKDFPNVTNIFIYSNLRDRIRRAITYYGVAPEKGGIHPSGTPINGGAPITTTIPDESGEQPITISVSTAMPLESTLQWEVVAAFVQAKDHPESRLMPQKEPA